MKIVLMSDSHDNLPALKKAVTWCNEHKVDHVLHAGDLVAPFVNRALKDLDAPYNLLFGNNDGERVGLKLLFKEKIFDPPFALTLDDKRILMLHAPILLDSLIESQKYDLILYGHTHEIDIREGKTLVVNPGELCGWLTGKQTMVLWDTGAGTLELIQI